jgi:hypothetical protein
MEMRRLLLRIVYYEKKEALRAGLYGKSIMGLSAIDAIVVRLIEYDQ